MCRKISFLHVGKGCMIEVCGIERNTEVLQEGMHGERLCPCAGAVAYGSSFLGASCGSSRPASSGAC